MNFAISEQAPAKEALVLSGEMRYTKINRKLSQMSKEEERPMNEPLAQRLRPKTLAEVCGQQHLLAPGRVFRRTIESGKIPNMIFYGPSGTGKTTVARIIAENSGMTLHKLNGPPAAPATSRPSSRTSAHWPGQGASCFTSTRSST